jgi:DNA polymerase-3 subunit gamma/tau
MSDSYKVLTRKYRPRSFDDVVSQDHVISTLRNAIAQNRISHAYLFCGPRGVGKTTMARVVARMINGVSMDVDGEELGRTLDIIEIDAASNSGVDDVRSLREGIRVPPQNGTYKVYIIDEVHMLSKSAFNALLKTLEEPPEYVKFIFATTEPHKVLPTVLSRVQRFDFRRIKVSEIVDRLRYICEQESITIDDASLHVIARKADGALRDALSIMDQAIAFCGSTIEHNTLLDALNVVSNDRLFELVDCAKNHDPRRAMEIIDVLLFDGHDIQEFLGALTEHLRNMYLAQDAGSMRLIEATDDEKARLKRSADGFSEQDLLRMMHLASETQYKVRDAHQPRIQLEIAILKLTTMDRSEGLNQLLSEIRDLKKKLHESGVDGDKPAESGATPTKSVSNTGATKTSAKNERVSTPASESATSTVEPPPTKSQPESAKTRSAPVKKSASAVESSPTTKPSAKPVSSNGASESLLNSYLNKSAIKKKQDAASNSQDPGTAALQRPASTGVQQRALSNGESGTESAPASNGLSMAPSGENSTQGRDTLHGEVNDTGFPRGVHVPHPLDDHKGSRDHDKEYDHGKDEDIDGEVDSIGDYIADDADQDEEEHLLDRTIHLHELQEAWPRWLEYVQRDCPQLVFFGISRTKLIDIREKMVHLECQDELTLQLIQQHERLLTTCFEKTVRTSLYIQATVRQQQAGENHNDPYTQFKKLQQADPKVRMIVDIFGAELEY